MPFKVPVTITLKVPILYNKDTSIVESKKLLDLQVVTIKELREIVEYMNNNIQALDNKVNKIGMTKVKLLFIECFNSTRLKLKKFLLQMRFKLYKKV